MAADVRSESTGVAPPANASHAGTVAFDGVAKRFWKGDAPVDAIRRVDLEVTAGEFVGLVGPSGCGKSTLLHMAAGLLAPTAGRVLYDGDPVVSVNTRVAYLTQKDNLIPWRTVEQNIALPLEIKRMDADTRRALVRSHVELVSLSGFERHYPAELSGGMKKRVALARMLVYGPETLLMDEPFGALDAQLKSVLQEELLRIWHERKPTILFVTHDLSEAISLCDRVVVLSARPSEIRLDHAVDLRRPREINRLRSDPSFLRIYDTLWEALREDIARGDEIAPRG